METNVTLVFCTICESGSHVAGGPENLMNMHPVGCVADGNCDYTDIAHLTVAENGHMVIASNLHLEICRSRADSWPFSAFKNVTFHPAINYWIQSVHNLDQGVNELADNRPVAH